MDSERETYHRLGRNDKSLSLGDRVVHLAGKLGGAVTGIDALGYMAGVCTTYAFWPQLRKTWVTRSAGDVSMGMLAIFSTGVGLWLCYGTLLGSWPIIITNGVTILLTIAILVLKVRFKS